MISHEDAESSKESLSGEPLGPLRYRSLFVLAAVLAAGSAYFICTLLPSELKVKTDVVGYPIHSNFNIDSYFHRYYLAVLFFPLATLALYRGLLRIGRRSTRQARAVGPLASKESEPQVGSLEAPIESEKPAPGRLLNVLLLGAAIGVSVGVGARTSDGNFLLVAAVVASGYLASVLALAVVVKRFILKRDYWTRVAATNIWGVPLLFPALYFASRASGIRVLSNDSFRQLTWMPLWVALAGSFVTAGIAWSKRAGDVRSLESKAVQIVTVPALLYLLLAGVPSSMGAMEVFHEGEQLAGAHLVLGGMFPWRDLMLIHGLFQDAFSAALGFVLFENSRWGAEVATQLILYPFFWIFTYLLGLYLFRRNRMFVLVTALVAAGGMSVGRGFVDAAFQPRFLLLPPALVAFGVLLRKPTLVRSLAFTWLLGIQGILTPESIFLWPCFGLILLGYEFFHRYPGRRLVDNFRRVLLCLLSGVLFGLLLLGFLWAHNAVGDFIYYFRTFAPNHRFTGGIPIAHGDARFIVAVIIPPVLIILSVWYFAWGLRRRRLHTNDWVMAGLALFVLFYYRKFLSRADEGHANQSFGVALPLLLYTVYRGIELIREWPQSRRYFKRLKPGRVQQLVTLPVAVSVLLLASPVTLTRLTQAPLRFRGAVGAEFPLARMGYALTNAIDLKLIADLQLVLRPVLGPQDAVFDFSNQPAIFHYLLGKRPVTRYYHVSMAIRRETQNDLLMQLRRKLPKLVVFYNGPLGLPAWDYVPNSVRHYEISKFIFANYEPLLALDGYVFFWRRGNNLSQAGIDQEILSRAVTRKRDSYFSLPDCDWGYAPNFLNIGNELEDKQGILLEAVPVWAASGRKVLQLSPPSGSQWRDFAWLEILPRAGRSLRPDRVVLSNDPKAPANWNIKFKINDDPPQSYRIQVGSCSQWYGFSAEPLYLNVAAAQDFGSIRVYP